MGATSLGVKPAVQRAVVVEEDAKGNAVYRSTHPMGAPSSMHSWPAHRGKRWKSSKSPLRMGGAAGDKTGAW